MSILIPYIFCVQIIIELTIIDFRDVITSRNSWLLVYYQMATSTAIFDISFNSFSDRFDLPFRLGHIFKPWNQFWRLTFTILKFLSYQPTPSKFWSNISHLGVIYEKKIEHCNNLIHWMPFDLMNDQKDMTNFFARDNLDTFALACEGSGHCLLRAPIFSILGKCIFFRM